MSEKQESASPAKNNGAQVLGAAVLLKYVLQDLVHYGDGEDHADGVAGPVCVEVVVLLGIPIGEKQDARLQNLEDDVGKKPRENGMQFAMHHAGEKGDF